jgi:hypothetical protein
MNSIVVYLSQMIAGAVGAADYGDGTYRIDLDDGSSRAATAAEILAAYKARRIADLNLECKTRLIARYGTAEEQVSRSIGVYGVAEQQGMQVGISSTIDASNAACNVVLGSTTINQVEAVTATWPVI